MELVDVLQEEKKKVWFTTYQVADHNLGFANDASTLGRGGLCGVAARLVFLNTAGRGGCSGASASRGAAGGASTAGTALGGKDLVERLIKLAGHFVGLIEFG